MDKSAESAKRPPLSGGDTAQKGSKPSIKPPEHVPETGQEEEGGISVLLQPGEQVLIGSLNISVKKFFFHAYLTDKRIFLIDTQEKKLKVTAKDIPRDTIAGSIIEFSESSDPVLVLSIRSADDEIKTMKLVFVQNGMDRSNEIDEWITLLHDEKSQKISREREAEVPEEQKEEPEPEFVRPEKPVHKQELHPTRKPVKDHEKQPPVKRLLSLYKVPEEGKEPDHETPPRRTQVREVPEPLKKPTVITEFDREIPVIKDTDGEPVRKSGVQSAMKVAMKGALKPLRQPIPQPVKRPVVEPVRQPGEGIEIEPGKIPARRPSVLEKTEHDEGGEVPQFCHNCGKKLPDAANFCPGCGMKLGQGRTLPNTRFHQAPREKKATLHDTLTYERKVPSLSREEKIDEEEREDEKPQPTKPPVKKAPKGSEMTILHKFLRR